MQMENLQKYCSGGKCVVLTLQSIFHKTMTQKQLKYIVNLLLYTYRTYVTQLTSFITIKL